MSNFQHTQTQEDSGTSNSIAVLQFASKTRENFAQVKI